MFTILDMIGKEIALASKQEVKEETQRFKAALFSEQMKLDLRDY